MGLQSNNNNGSGLFRPQADINVTPLVDVMLVLLIIFMITAPLLATGVKVNLPQAKVAQPLDQTEPITVTVGKDGKLSLGADEVEIDRLADLINTRNGGDLSRVVQLRGDKEAPYGAVVAVMDTLVANGMARIAIITDGKGAVAPPAATPAAK
ncbi:MAG: biopolymer transporter ExbD [Hyphomicrobiales bacterium]|nr:biopolymer transporter ExbD [Hyphomicrobiales bacterium]